MSALEQTPVAPETPAIPPAPETAAAPAAPEKPASLRETIAEGFKAKNQHAQHQPREQGRFAGPPQIPATPAVPAVPVVTQRPDMPKSLKLELKQHWEAAHPELATAIHQRETDYEKGLEGYKGKATQLEELLSAFKPYEAMMRAENATPKQVIANLMQTAAILRTGSPVQKAHAAAQMMRQFGIPFEQVGQLLSGTGAPAVSGNAAPGIDPQAIDRLIDQRLTQFQNQQIEARSQSLIEEFGARPEYKHFAGVRSTMAALLQSEEFLSKNATLGELDLLKAAYDRAIWTDPDIRKELLAEQEAKRLADLQEKNRTQVAQARQAAVSVTGAPASGPAPPPDPKNLRGLITNAMNRAQR